MNNLPEILEPGEPVRLATGYVFTEGPLWDPRGHYYFADVRSDKLLRVVPGETPQKVRDTRYGNGTTFDLLGRLIQCEGHGKCLTRWNTDTDEAEVLLERIDGKRLNRPNDVVCHSDGSLYFTDPDMRIDVAERELDPGVWRIAPDGTVEMFALCEYPNGLAFSPDEKRLYVANTRTLKYIQEIVLDAEGKVAKRRVLHDMSYNLTPGSPDGVKVDVLGRIYCTGPGGIWVLDPSGVHLGTIRLPEPAVNFCFGGDDLRTLFVCAHSSIYTLRVKTPGLAQPGAAARLKQAA